MTNVRLEGLGKYRVTIIVAVGCLLATLAVSLVFMVQPARASCPEPPCVPDPNTNTPPSVLLDNNNPVTVNEGQTATKSGTYDDPDQNNVSISASPVGNIVNKTGTYTGNWTWSFSTSDNQSRTITTTASDGLATGSAEFNLTVNNVAPTATGISAPLSVNEGSNFLVSLTGVFDPSSADMGSLQYRFDCGSGYSVFGSTNSRSCSTTDNGNLTVRGQVRDKDGGQSTEYSRSVTVNNVAPTATANASGTPVTTGTNFTVSLTNPSDPSSADTAQGFTYAFDCANDGVFEYSGTSDSASCTANNGLSQTVKYRITDKDGGSSTYQKNVTLNDTTRPVVDPDSLVPGKGTTITDLTTLVSATFSEEMKPETISTSTFKLQQYNKKKKTWKTVLATVDPTVVENRTVATLDPLGNAGTLSAGKKYRAIITTGAKDLANNSLAKNFVWTFTTAR
jgi:hypothetical protein